MKKKFKLGPLQKMWIEYLELYPEQQGTGMLGRMTSEDEPRMCCLGAACQLLGTGCWIAERLHDGLDRHYLSESYEALGLRSREGNPRDPVKFEDLAALNDDHKEWPTIAAILRKNPEQYFTKSV